jgi:L-alanine-DL-glutamate epimerase-like enolase superfamily enzyme
MQEWEAADDAIYQEVTEGKYPVQKNGVIALPEGPGLGIAVDFTQFKKLCPYKPITRTGGEPRGPVLN